MPYIYEQIRPLYQPAQRQSLVQRQSSTQPRTSQRLSSIPRPTKQLVVDQKPASISHASKPTRDTLPPPTPIKSPNRTRVLGHDERLKMPTLDADPELAVLELLPFSGQPFVNFNEVKLGTTRLSYVVLRNSRDFQQQLVVKSFPKLDKGIYMDATEFIIAPHTEICVALAWTPKVVGGLRDSITLQDVKKMSWRIVLMGSATRPKPAPSVTRSTRNVPRLFRKSPSKVNRQLQLETRKAFFSPRTTIKSMKMEKPLTRLNDESPKKRHQLVRNILSQYDQEMAIKVQSYCRMILEKRKLEQMKAVSGAAVVIQSYTRRFIAQRSYERVKNAAIVIQKHFRGQIVRRDYQAKRRAAIIVQKHIRGCLVRRQYRNKAKAATILQKYIRGCLVRRKCRARLEAAIILQRHVRGCLARRICRARLDAIIVLQKHVRGCLARRECQTRLKAVIIVQKYLRGYLVRRECQTRLKAVIIVQKYLRGYLVRRECRSRLKAAITLQKYIRGYLVRRECRSRLRATITLQKYIRGYLVRRECRSRLEAAITLQKYIRGYLVRRECQAKVRAAIVIQKQVRMYQVRSRYLRTIEAMNVLQKSFQRLTGRMCKISFRDDPNHGI